MLITKYLIFIQEVDSIKLFPNESSLNRKIRQKFHNMKTHFQHNLYEKKKLFNSLHETVIKLDELMFFRK